jgi:hypothetical protein
VRARVPHREDDVLFHDSFGAVTTLVRSGALVEAVEAEVGRLR